MHATEVVHTPPQNGLSFCPCCDRTMNDLPPFDRVSFDPTVVTCGRLTSHDELMLRGRAALAPAPGRRATWHRRSARRAVNRRP
jgi:hypothetical protein